MSLGDRENRWPDSLTSRALSFASEIAGSESAQQALVSSWRDLVGELAKTTDEIAQKGSNVSQIAGRISDGTPLQDG